MELKTTTTIETTIPGISKNKWNNKILIEIGANKIKAKGTHFFNNNNPPIITSRIPTIGKIYPVVLSEFKKSPAAPVGVSIGIKRKNLLAPNTTNTIPKSILTIFVN